jgi:sugar/nucleoside kinase (ribokinase family)
MRWEDATFTLPDPSGYRFQAAGMGLNAVDQLIAVDRYPARGGKEAIRSIRVMPGGQVATAMIACRRLGLEKVRYLGKVGDDEAGRLSRRSLEESGVDCRYLLTEPDTPNQAAVILIDGETGERTIFWQRSDRLNMTSEELPVESFCCAPVLLVDGHDQDAAIRCAAVAKGRGIATMLDVDRVRSRTRELLPLIDFCIGSETFPRDLTGEPDLDSALIRAAKECPGFLAATLGPSGVAFAWEGRVHRVPGFAVPAVDTTGAGDVFHGAFLYGLVQGWPLGRILPFANAAAALNCTALGARGGLRPAAEVLDFMARA